MMVYRVENDRCEGPYNTPDTEHPAFRNAHMALNQMSFDIHPNPSQEGLERYLKQPTYVCGFDSMESLENWFSKNSREHFAEAGYEVSCYNVPDRDVEEGRYQLMFDRDHADLVCVGPLL